MKKASLWYFVLVVIMFVWGTFYPLSKISVKTIDPLLMAFLRYFIGLAPLVPFFIVQMRKSGIKIPPKDILGMGSLGLLGITGFSILLFIGIKLSTATNGSLLANTQPIFTTLLAPVMMAEGFSGIRLAGAVIGIMGMVLVITKGSFSGLDFSSQALVGNALLVGAAVVMSLYNILIKPYLEKYNGLIPTVITMGAGTFFLFFPVLFTRSGFKVIGNLQFTDILLLLYIGVVTTSLMYLLFNKTIQAVDVVNAMGFKSLIPVFGTLLSLVLIGEKAGFLTYMGFIIVILSIFFIQKTPRVKNKLFN
ncbi:MAG: DMT family transporter [Spirochaetota bacterium]